MSKYIFKIEGDSLPLDIHDNVSSIKLSPFIDYKKHDYQWIENIRAYLEAKDLFDKEGGKAPLDPDAQPKIDAVRLMVIPNATEDQLLLFEKIPLSIEEDGVKFERYYNFHYDITQDIEGNILQDISIDRLYYHYINLFNHWIVDVYAHIKDRIALLKQQFNKLGKEYKMSEALAQAIVVLDQHFIAKDLVLPLEQYLSMILFISAETGLCEYDKEKLSFDYKGDKYHVGKKDIETFYEQKGITTGEYVTIKNVRQLMQEKLYRHTDIEGLYEMELSLYEMAILCRKEGEQLPYFSVARDKYLQDRGKHFEDIDMATYYNVCFFLITSLLQSASQELTGAILKIFGKALEMSQTLGDQKQTKQTTPE